MNIVSVFIIMMMTKLQPTTNWVLIPQTWGIKVNLLKQVHQQNTCVKRINTEVYPTKPRIMLHVQVTDREMITVKDKDN